MMKNRLSTRAQANRQTACQQVTHGWYAALSLINIKGEAAPAGAKRNQERKIRIETPFEAARAVHPKKEIEPDNFLLADPPLMGDPACALAQTFKH